MEKQRILVIEDDESIRYLLRQNLEFEGYEVLEADNGETGLQKTLDENPDLLLLDLMLPQMSGMELCKRLRAQGRDTPIIMLTARGQQMDKILGLKAGADDYICKPFDILELAARIEALLRRATPQQTAPSIAQIGHAEFDYEASLIRKEGEELSLKKVERMLLQYFVENHGKVLSREQIMKDVWGHDELLSNRTIDTHVTYLRKKIEKDPSNPEHILTIHRVGYRFIK